MLRKEQRRYERRQSLRKRLLAGSTALVIALGTAVGGTAPALAAKPTGETPTPITDPTPAGQTTYNVGGLVCDSDFIDFTKPDEINDSTINKDGSFEPASPNNWGSLEWRVGAKEVSWTIEPGWDVDICIKGGTYITTIDTDVYSGDSYVHTWAGLSHLGYRINSVPTPDPKDFTLACDTVTVSYGRALVDGDHITVKLHRDGSATETEIHARVNSSIAGGYLGLGLRVNGVAQPIPLTEEEVRSGTIVFGYTQYFTASTFAVKWIQMNDMYFNKDGQGDWFRCGTTEPTPVDPSAQLVQYDCLNGVSIGGYITVDLAQPGVLYTVRDSSNQEVAFDEVTGRTAKLAVGSYTVTGVDADSADDYAVSAYSEPFTVAAYPGVCDLTTLSFITPAASQAVGCDTSGSYTLRDEVIDGERVVQWYAHVGPTKPANLDGYELVDPALYGSSIPGVAGQTVHVRAVAISPIGIEPGATTDWMFEFGEPVPCTPPPCIPDEFISYTYDPSTNSGVVTVRQPSGYYSDELCKPLYVTAAAWAFNRVDNIWTQTLVATKEINEGAAITTVGVYPYGVLVGCGQGDIYASRTAFPQPSPLLLGPNKPAWPEGVTPWVFQETFLHDMKFTGPKPTYMVTEPGCNALEPVAPTVVAITACDTVGSLTVTTSPYISYVVRTDEGDVVDTISYDAAVGITPVVVVGATEGSFTVTPVASFPYILKNYTPTDSQWNPDLGTRTDCPEDPSFGGGTSTASQCDNDTPWINYSIVVNDPDGQLTSTTARLIFKYPGDASKNYELVLGTVTPGEVFSGRTLWPGASVDPVTGEPTGWPGWAVDAEGNWVETAYDENFRWTRFVTEVTLQVNPEMNFALSYPPPSANCVSEPIEVSPVAEKSTCVTGGASILMPPVEGVLWFLNNAPVEGSLLPTEVLEAGEYVVRAEIDPDAEGGPYAFASGAVTQWRFVFTDDEICDFTTLPTTNASIGFIDPTCEVGQKLDPSKLLPADSLAELESYREFDDGRYEVVFVTTDPEARFFDSIPPAEGRTVSAYDPVDEVQRLTFTGQLLGPDRSDACVTTVELKDPVSYVDTCLLGGSFTVYRVDGIVYTVTVRNPSGDVVENYVVDWAPGQLTRTYEAAEGYTVRVEPSPESDRFTIAPDPVPFERTFAVYDDDCLPTLPLTESSVTFAPASCLDATNWVVLPNTEGVQWWVDGEPASAGSWPMPAGEVVVQATPLQGYGFGLEAETRWEYEFAPADEESCDLPTLAMTGASNGLVGVALLAVLITLAGFGVVLGRRLQQA